MDFKRLSKNLGLDEKEYIDLANIFIDTSANDLAALQSAILQGDRVNALEIAHSMKGAALNMGIEEFTDIVVAIERELLEGIGTELNPLMQKFAALLDGLHRAIE